jgi:hypothetical protein
MVASFSDWLCNLLLWGAVIALGALLYHSFAAPILGGVNALVGLGVAVVLSLFWPRF